MLKKVLIVDDEKEDRYSVRADISPLIPEIEILEANNLEEALKILESGVDVAFIDRYFDMEDLGVKFIINNANRFRNTAFYLNSRETDEDSNKKIIESGGKGSLNKSDAWPIDYVLAIGFSENEANKRGYRRPE